MRRKIKPEKITRRDFIEGASVGAAAAAAGSLAANAEAATEEAAQVSAAAGCVHVTVYSGTGDWLGPPPAVADSDISRTVATEVLVLGGGHAGLMAAIAATDLRAKVAVVETQNEAGFLTDYWHRLGEDIGHVNSKWLIKKGYGPYDTGEIVQEFCKRAGGRVNPEILRLYVENSGPMFDRMVEIYEEYADMRKANDSKVQFRYTGENARVETYDFSNVMSDEMVINQTQRGVDPKDYPIVIGGYKTWPCNAQFMGPTVHAPVGRYISVLRWFEKYHEQKSKDQGADWYYEHSAVVLTQDRSGAVTGAIARSKDGKYVRFNASKGVVVATGDFAGNPDMCWSLLSEAMEWAERGGTPKEKFTTKSIRNGTGHKMCIWAGGRMEPSPRGYMGGGGGTRGPWGSGPMLQLNAHAKRFVNEAAAPLVGPAAMRQPVGIMCCVTDKKFMKSVEAAGLEHGGPNYGRPVYYEETEADMGKVLGTGKAGYKVRGCTVAERQTTVVFGAQTLEELAGYLGYEGALVETFVESIKHYNELCRADVDSDFGKDAKAMIPIDEPPYYGCASRNSGTARMGMVTMSGIITDDKLRVLDKNGKPIKGLFVAGNTVGGRYGPGYSTPFAGNSIGMALTHGWMAGKFATTL